MARNTALKRVEKQSALKRGAGRALPLEELKYEPGGGISAEDSLSARELASELSRFLRQQSRLDRYIFLRRYFFGDKVSEIARAADIAPHKVSLRLFRLRSRLKAELIRKGLL